MVAFNGGSQQPIKRKGMFLNPTSSNSSPSPPPPVAAVSIAGDEPKYNIRWWVDPQRQWDEWVEKLNPKYHTLWKKAGVFDAIRASRLTIRRDPPSLLRVARFWCKETNTFLFPWAEATLTLEDVMILGGFSILGEPVRVKEPLGGVIRHMVSKMIAELKKWPRAEQWAVMNRYVNVGKGDEIEHIAFLSLWLSRFVLITGKGDCITGCVFQVAVRLARGMRIALAPAVLASIYRELQVVKDHVCNKSLSSLAVRALFNILQMWMWERFPALRPNSRVLTDPNTPRAAKWCSTGKIPKLSSIMEVLKSHAAFECWPYALESKIEHRHSFYLDEGGWFCSDVTKDEELQSFARCLRASKLVGLDCIEQYQPHRVAMQFALDQDIPGFLPRANSTWEDAWKTYDISLNNVKFYVPPRHFKSAVTLQYLNWRRNIIKKEGKGFNETELSARPVLRPHDISSKSICCKSQEQQACTMKPLHTELNLTSESSETMNQNFNVTREIEVASERQQKEELGPDNVNEEEITEVGKKTNAGELHHDLKATEKSKEENEKQLGEESQPEPLYVNEEIIMKYPVRTNPVEADHEWAVAEKLEAKRKREEIEERDPARKKELEHESKRKREETKGIEERDPARKKELVCESKCETEEIEEQDPVRKKELERDRKTNQLKEEIAAIQAQIRYWESLAEAHSKSELISSRI